MNEKFYRLCFIVFIIHSAFIFESDVKGKEMTESSYITYETGANPDCVVIWLHGLGADGNDFLPIAKQLDLPESLRVKFLFPHAPEIPVTINNKMLMPAWYDVYSTGIDREVDVNLLQKSSARIAAMIDTQREEGIASEKIVVAGFSQGGAVAYHTVLGYPYPLGGLLAMSTYFATANQVNLHPANSDVPILIQHGSYDSIVGLQLGEKARAVLDAKGYSSTFETYPMDHSVCLEQVQSISRWLQKVLQ